MRIAGLALAALVAAGALASAAGAAPAPGGPCPAAGKVSGSLKCVRRSGKLRWVKAGPAAAKGGASGGGAVSGSPWSGSWSGTYVLTLHPTCTGSMCPTTSPAYCDPTSPTCRQTATDTCPAITLRGSASGSLTVSGTKVSGRLTLADGFPTIGLPPPSWGHGCEVAKRDDAHIVITGSVSGDTLDLTWYHVGHAGAAESGTLTLRGSAASGSLGDNLSLQLRRG